MNNLREDRTTPESIAEAFENKFTVIREVLPYSDQLRKFGSEIVICYMPMTMKQGSVSHWVWNGLHLLFSSSKVIIITKFVFYLFDPVSDS